MISQVVRGYLFNEDWKVLLVKHNDQGRWVLPWWHLESWETLYQAFEREIKEETWLDIEIFGELTGEIEENILPLPLPVSIYQVDYVSKKWWPKQKLEYIFFADVIWWNFKIQDEEVFAYNWFSVEELLNMSIESETYPQIPYTLEKNLYLLEDYETLEEHSH